MFRTHYFYQFIILFVLLLSGCMTPSLFQSQLSLFDKGISSAEAYRRVNLKPLASTSVDMSERSFQFDMFYLNNGSSRHRYILAFEGDSLLYWGYVSEFRRQSDKVLNDALNIALPALYVAESTH